MIFGLRRISFVANFGLVAVFLFVAVCSLGPIILSAQDLGADQNNEVLREVDAELRTAEIEKARLTERIGDLDERLHLLRRSRQLRVEIKKLERGMDLAADDGELESLHERLASTELDIEEVHAKLELIDHKMELGDLTASLGEAGLEEDSLRAVQLLVLYSKTRRLVAQLFDALRRDDEAKASSVEEQIEFVQAEYELRFAILRLKLELHSAEAEGEEEAVGEFKSELKQLQLELKAFDNGGTPAAPTIDTSRLPKPVRPTVEEIAAASEVSFDDKIKPLLQTFCFECHDASTSGDLNLQSLVDTRPWVVNRSDWANVVAQLKVRSMPPPDDEQPKERECRLLVAWMTAAIENFDYTTVRQPGYETARRLSHHEYNNTLRDLVGIDLRPAEKFPTDMTASSGLDNSANSLFIQPVMMERYIGAAESIVRKAFPAEPSSDPQRDAMQRLLGGDSPRQAVLRFATRAFRRPLESNETSELLEHFDQLVQSGADPQTALPQTLQVILVSPSFLMRIEDDRESVSGEPYRISDYELANRLSYFLWASMPDDRLFQLAADNSLSDPVTLRGEVDRMIRDQRAETLGSIFASQWLGFSQLTRVPRDQIDNPWATESLVQAMQDESAMFFHSLVTSNAPIERLIDADYTFLNEELAKHYEISGVQGDEMRRVSLDGTPRGGILGHGSILTVTSFPRRTSPVVRGNWILSTLLGTPPPPAPPNVSEFDDRIAENRFLTQRQKLERHRSNPNCYACHQEIDPLGFALEHFEWFGRHRPARRGKPIDASGELPGGVRFEGLPGLQQALIAQRRDDLIEQVTRMMLSYALGRQLEYYDEAVVDEIVADVKADEGQIHTLIHAIVQSDTFQMKQIPRAPTKPEDRS